MAVAGDVPIGRPAVALVEWPQPIEPFALSPATDSGLSRARVVHLELTDQLPLPAFMPVDRKPDDPPNVGRD